MYLLSNRRRRRRVFTLGWLGVAAAAGCASPLSTSPMSNSGRQEAAGIEHDEVANDPKLAAIRKANGQQPETPEQALAGVLDELQEIRAIDPAAQEQILEDLKNTKPEHYALVVSQFRSALSYRRQLAERERRAETQLAADSGDDNAEAPGRVQASPSRSRDRDAPVRMTANRSPQVPSDQFDDVPTTSSPHAIYNQATSARSTALGTPLTSRGTGRVSSASAIFDQGLEQPHRNAAYLPTADSAEAGDWRGNLDRAIADLADSLPPHPSTTAELHDHLRLRALLLLADRKEEAYLPLAGASPAQQDYWSKQLFALDAYLNGAQLHDDKQRAAAALVYLDEARSALSQLATLQVRNLSFVKRVDGYGAYEPLTHASFRPGEQATLYAEAECFTSTSSAEGYETSLGTSYQVLDATGRRVDGGQFPDVRDVCRGRRRDFYLQYGVAMPKGIYPGDYRLELTITDHRSGKIGQASLPFAIGGVER